MRPSQVLESNRAAIRDIAARHRVLGVRVFGSVVRGTDTDGSDLDLLVEPTGETTLLDIGKIQFEISELLGIDVDVLTPGALPAIMREKILAEAQLV
ncbi:MAG: nucleotidyltransferase family protein [Burkholderiales bacterium]